MHSGDEGDNSEGETPVPRLSSPAKVYRDTESTIQKETPSPIKKPTTSPSRRIDLGAAATYGKVSVCNIKLLYKIYVGHKILPVPLKPSVTTFFKNVTTMVGPLIKSSNFHQPLKP